MKGGTALNLFVHDMPRLSIDIDVVFVPYQTRRLALTPRNRMQSVHLRESPFDRRNGMAQLNVDIAGVSAGSHRFTISYLDRSVADNLAAELGDPKGSRLDHCHPFPKAGGDCPGTQPREGRAVEVDDGAGQGRER